MATTRTRATRPWRWTRRYLARLPDDGFRYEVADGQLIVTPLPSVPHQGVALKLARYLDEYVERHGLGIAT